MESVSPLHILAHAAADAVEQSDSSTSSAQRSPRSAREIQQTALAVLARARDEMHRPGGYVEHHLKLDAAAKVRALRAPVVLVVGGQRLPEQVSPRSPAPPVFQEDMYGDAARQRHVRARLSMNVDASSCPDMWLDIASRRIPEVFEKQSFAEVNFECVPWHAFSREGDMHLTDYCNMHIGGVQDLTHLPDRLDPRFMPDVSPLMYRTVREGRRALDNVAYLLQPGGKLVIRSGAPPRDTLVEILRDIARVGFSIVRLRAPLATLCLAAAHVAAPQAHVVDDAQGGLRLEAVSEAARQ